MTCDNIFHRVDDLLSKGISFANMETGEDLCNVRDKLLFANAYIGARPIVEALDGLSNWFMRSLTLITISHPMWWRILPAFS